jgi:citrate lyase subunit beta/citryl-CoA lyase
VFDVTLDCEDGAPVGGEADHAALVTRIWPWKVPHGPAWPCGCIRWTTPLCADMATIAGQAGHRLTHIMVPKVESVDDVASRAALVTAPADHLPLHVLIESPAAVHRAFDIAAHPAGAVLSFGLMDFVSAHGGAIP